MLESRQRDSQHKRARVLATVNDMKAKGETITFLAIALSFPRYAGGADYLVRTGVGGSTTTSSAVA
ncbi:hypothetical protein [Kitasatospora sp. NPDC059327]|uniref:hypothetical protein n=1 Tax=Kitasatospora sp. NPDC059327 TaxID=3346803 RepID=UPI00369D55A0